MDRSASPGRMTAEESRMCSPTLRLSDDREYRCHVALITGADSFERS